MSVNSSPIFKKLRDRVGRFLDIQDSAHPVPHTSYVGSAAAVLLRNLESLLTSWSLLNIRGLTQKLMINSSIIFYIKHAYVLLKFIVMSRWAVEPWFTRPTSSWEDRLNFTRGCTCIPHSAPIVCFYTSGRTQYIYCFNFKRDFVFRITNIKQSCTLMN